MNIECAIQSRTNGAVTAAPLEVWLVDDDATFGKLMSELLNLEPGLNCSRQFCSVAEVLAALRQETPPDVILLDYEMPAMNGVEAVPHILKLAVKTRILMVTTFYEELVKRQVLAAGAGGYFLKVDDFEEIAAAITGAASANESQERI